MSLLLEEKKHKTKTKTNDVDPGKKDEGTLVMESVSDQVTDLLKKVLTQKSEELSKKFSLLEQKMTAHDVGVSNLGAIGIEGQRMTGNDFMLSVMRRVVSRHQFGMQFCSTCRRQVRSKHSK